MTVGPSLFKPAHRPSGGSVSKDRKRRVLIVDDHPIVRQGLRRLIEAGVPLDGASDHGVSEALYLRDPDQNGVERYWDRPREEWPRDRDGAIAMTTRALDL